MLRGRRYSAALAERDQGRVLVPPGAQLPCSGEPPRLYRPDFASFYPLLQLCVCYDRLGDRETAESYHRRARALKPEDAAVQYNERYFASLHGTEQESPCKDRGEPV